MAERSLSTIYADYIDCLNSQNWADLRLFVQADVHYNGQIIGLPGYREMLERDFRKIPDLHFEVQILISDPPYIASRLGFDCSPRGRFLNLDIDGRRVSFSENVFYKFVDQKIGTVWSVIDKAAIESQLQ